MAKRCAGVEVPHKRKTYDLSSFRRWSGLSAQTRTKKAYDLRKLGNIGKGSKLHRHFQSLYQNENLINTCKKPLKKRNFSHNTLFHMKTRVSVKYLMNDCRSSARSNMELLQRPLDSCQEGVTAVQD